jgi:RNA polymerase sigma-70 factor (ECF subfamily)
MADLRKILAGDGQSWEQLVRTQTRRLHSIAWAVTRDASFAEDIVQNVFLRILERGLPRLRRGSLPSYLARMTCHAAIDTVRRRDASQRREERYAMTQSEKGDSPIQAILSAEDRLKLRQAFCLLQVDARLALWLHLVEGESIREVAACLKCSTSTAWKRVQEGTRTLRAHLTTSGIAVGVVAPWTDILGSIPPSSISPESVERIVSLGASIPVNGYSHVAILSGAIGMNAKKITALALVAFLFLSVGGLLVSRWFRSDRGAGPTSIATNKAADGAAITDRNRGLQPEHKDRIVNPGPDRDQGAGSDNEKNLREDFAEDLTIVDGAVIDAETSEPVAEALVRLDDSLDLKGLDEEQLERKQRGIPPREDENENEKKKSLSAKPVRQATTGSDGRFSLTLPTSQPFKLFISAEGYAPTDFSSSGSDELEEIIIRIHPALEIQGLVLDAEGRPVDGAEIAIGPICQGISTRFSNDRGPRNIQKSGADGSFILVPEAMGEASLSVWKPGYGGIQISGIQPGSETLIVRIPAGSSISGTVTDKEGKPVAGAIVSWWTMKPEFTNWSGEAHSNEKGEFFLAGLPAPASHFVGLVRYLPSSSMRDPATGRFLREIQVQPGDSVEDIDLFLGALKDWDAARQAREISTFGQDVGGQFRQLLRVTGRIVDPAGHGVPRAEISVSYSGDGARFLSSAHADVRGIFECQLQIHKADTYRGVLEASHVDWAPAKMEIGVYAAQAK